MSKHEPAAELEATQAELTGPLDPVRPTGSRSRSRLVVRSGTAVLVLVAVFLATALLIPLPSRDGVGSVDPFALDTDTVHYPSRPSIGLKIERDHPDGGTQGIVLINEDVVVVERYGENVDDWSLRAHDRHSGIERWTVAADERANEDDYPYCLGVDGVLHCHIGTADGSMLQILDPSSGAVTGEFDLAATATGYSWFEVVQDGLLLALEDADGFVFQLRDGRTGEERWTSQVEPGEMYEWWIDSSTTESVTVTFETEDDYGVVRYALADGSESGRSTDEESETRVGPYVITSVSEMTDDTYSSSVTAGTAEDPDRVSASGYPVLMEQSVRQGVLLVLHQTPAADTESSWQAELSAWNLESGDRLWQRQDAGYPGRLFGDNLVIDGRAVDLMTGELRGRTLGGIVGVGPEFAYTFAGDSVRALDRVTLEPRWSASLGEVVGERTNAEDDEPYNYVLVVDRHLVAIVNGFVVVLEPESATFEG